jgi:hypothetical protein
MIRTMYTNSEELLDILGTYRPVTAAEKEDIIRAAAAAVDLGITVVNTRKEYDQVLAQIPKKLLFRTIEVEDGWILIHGRVAELQVREQ